MQSRYHDSGAMRLAVCAVVVTVATAILASLHLTDRPLTAALILLCLVLLIATIWGFRYATLMAALSGLAFAWLAPPKHDLLMRDARDLFTLTMFLVVGLIGSYLSDRANRETVKARQRQGEAEAARQRFADLVNAVEGIVWEADAQTRRFLFVSQQAERILGYPAEEWLSEPTFWQDHLHPADQERAEALWTAAAVGQRNDGLECRMVAADGRIVWLRAIVTAEAPIDRAAKLRGVLVDVTERKRAEEVLRRSEQNLAEAQRLTHTGSWIRDPHTADLTHVSEEWFRVYGFAPEAGVPTREAFLERIHPDDRDQVNTLIHVAIPQRRGYVGNFRIVLPDGTLKHIETIGNPEFDATGEVVEYVGTAVDVTERKRAEEERLVHLWFLESMDRVNRAIQGADTLEAVMSDVLDAVLEIFACDRAWLIHPCDPDAPTWRAVMERTRPEYPGAFALGASLPIDAEISRIFRLARTAPGALRFGAGAELSVPAEEAERFQIRSQICMVVAPGVGPAHLFGLHQCSHPRSWTAQEERLFQEIGRRLEDRLATLLTLQNLRESEARLEEAQRIAHVGYWDHDLTTDRITVSDETCRIVGLALHERTLSLTELMDRVHPDDRETLAQVIAAGRQDGISHSVEFRILRPDGHIRTVHSQDNLLTDAAGQPCRRFGTVQDITERKRAEEALRRSEAYLTEAQTLTHTGSWAWDPRTDRMVHCSAEIFQIYGLDPGPELPTPQELLTRVHPEDRARMRAATLDGVKETAHHFLEYRLLFPDGTIKHIRSIRRTAVNDRGTVVEIVGTAMDITERKRTEEQLRAGEERYRYLFEAAGVSLWEEDFSEVKAAIDALRTQGIEDFPAYFAEHPEFLRNAISLVRVTDVNEATVRMYGARDKAEMLVSLPRVFLPETVDAFAGILLAIAEGRTFFEAETIAQSLHGERLALLFTVAFPLPSSRLDRVLVSITDITQRKRAEEALQQAQAELAHVTRVATVGVLTSSIAHEVNQPLAAIVTNGGACLRWLAGEPPDLDEARQAVERIIKEGNRASEIIRRIRSLVRKAPPKRERFDLNEAIRDVIALALGEAQRHGVTLKTHLAEGLPPVLGDRVPLQQVILNLAINGIEATGGLSEGPRELLVRSAWDGADRVLVAVQDTGIGLDPAHLPQLFEAFYTTKLNGMGMGLAISRSIIEAHGGRLWAEPGTPRGAIFQFILPLDRTPLEDSGGGVP